MKTEDLEQKIKRTKQLDINLIKQNQPPSFGEHIQTMLNEQGIRKTALIKAMNVDRNYGYQILNGIRKPTRVQVIRIALFLSLDLTQTQRLLNIAGREALYVRRPEDAKTVYCLEHKMPFSKACEYIWGTSQ